MSIIDRSSPNSNRKPPPPSGCWRGCHTRICPGSRIPKSMSLGQLALHVATIPGNIAQLAAHGHRSGTADLHPSRSRNGR